MLIFVGPREDAQAARYFILQMFLEFDTDPDRIIYNEHFTYLSGNWVTIPCIHSWLIWWIVVLFQKSNTWISVFVQSFSHQTTISLKQCPIQGLLNNEVFIIPPQWMKKKPRFFFWYFHLTAHAYLISWKTLLQLLEMWYYSEIWRLA